jgi:hypothetical protein
MHWHKISIEDSNIFDIYQNKYGSGSDFGSAQKIMYSHPEIKKSFKKALSWLNLKETHCLLDIGINNGYELSILEDFYGENVIRRIDLIGFDLVENSLNEAYAILNRKGYRLRLIQGDIRNFSGHDIFTKETFVIKENSIDVVVALTSIQSSSLIKNFDIFLEQLVLRLKNAGCIFIAIPNCHVGVSGQIIKGQFNAHRQDIDLLAADLFIQQLETKLANHGFSFKSTGELYHFLYFYRQ